LGDRVDHFKTINEFDLDKSEFSDWEKTYEFKEYGKTIAVSEPSFEKLDFADPSIKDGTIAWNDVDNADAYRVRAYAIEQGDPAEILYESEKQSGTEYDLSNIQDEIDLDVFSLAVEALDYPDTEGEIFTSRSRSHMDVGDPKLTHYTVSLEHRGYADNLGHEDELFLMAIAGTKGEEEPHTVEIAADVLGQDTEVSYRDWEFNPDNNYWENLNDFNPEDPNISDWETTYDFKVDGQTEAQFEVDSYQQLDFAKPSIEDDGTIDWNDVEDAAVYRLRAFKPAETSDDLEMLDQTEPISDSSYSAEEFDAFVQDFSDDLNADNFVLAVEAMNFQDGYLSERSHFYTQIELQGLESEDMGWSIA